MLDPLAPHALSPSELKQLLAAGREGEPFFAFKDAEERLALFRAGRGDRVLTVGRGPEMDLSVAWDDEVSGLHAELQAIGGEWTIVDDGLSTNGTFVNAQRVAGRRRLRDADRVRVGRTILVYRARKRLARPRPGQAPLHLGCVAPEPFARERDSRLVSAPTQGERT